MPYGGDAARCQYVGMIDLSGGVPGLDGRAPTSFDEFWPFFVSQHLHPRTRAAHAVGLTVALVSTAGLLTGRARWRWVGAGLAGGALQLASHFVWEGNSPRDTDRMAASPWWIARADLRMVRDVYLRRIDRDVRLVRRALGLAPSHVTLSAARPREAA